MIKYTNEQLTLIADRLLDYIANRPTESAPIGDVVEFIRHDLKFKVPGRQDERMEFLHNLGFCVETWSRKTDEPATNHSHGAYYWRVSL